MQALAVWTPGRKRDGPTPAFVDDDDWERLSRWRWAFVNAKKGALPVRFLPDGAARHTRTLGREVMGLPDGDTRAVTRIDTNGWNYTRANLRVVEPSTPRRLARSEPRKQPGGVEGTQGEKTCTYCHETKPLVAFSVNRARADGLQSLCRVCHRVQVKAGRARRAGRIVSRP